MTINVIYIGIGEQGGSIVNEVKKYAENNSLFRPGLRFVVFDSHQGSLDKLLHIADVDKIHLLEPDDITIRNEFPEFHGKMEPKAAGGNGRLKGRLFWLFNRIKINSYIDNLIDRVRAATESNFFVFVIISALGGGTGSGSFLELAVYLKNHPSLVQSPPMIVGIGILPGGKDENDVALANGYAALKEVNFLQCLDHPRKVTIENIELNYSKPFDFYFILDREYARVTQDEEIRKAIISFLTAFGWFEFNPTIDSQTFKDEYEEQKETGVFFKEISNFRALGEPIRDYFHTIGYYQIFFPRDDLLLLYDIEDEIKDLDTEISPLKFESNQFDKGNDRLSEKEELKRKTNELDAVRITLTNRLKNPPTARRYHYFQQLPLNTDEIDILRKKENRERLKNPDICFKEIMEILGKSDLYYQLTHEQINRASFIDKPMINYDRIAENHITPGMMKILTKEDRDFFPDKDNTGKRIMVHERIKLLLAICSTCERNIERTRLAVNRFRDNVKQYYAKDGSIVLLDRDDESYSFNVYFALLGLQPWRPSETMPPRLVSLSKMEESYERQIQNENVLENHSLFIGSPNTTSEIIDIPYKFDDIEMRDDTLKFWIQMDLVNPKAIWNNVPLVISELFESLKKIKEILDSTKKTFGNVKIGEKYSDFSLISLYDVLKYDICSKLRDTATFYQEERIKVENSISAIERLLKGIRSAYGNEVHNVSKKHIHSLTRECTEFIRNNVLPEYSKVLVKLNMDEAKTAKNVLGYLDIHEDKAIRPSAKEVYEKIKDSLIEIRNGKNDTVDALNNLTLSLDDASALLEELYGEIVL